MNKLKMLGLGLWGGLGAYRGNQEYRKEFNKQHKRYLKDPHIYLKPQYYYLTSFGYSLGFFCGYIIPPFCLFHLVIEMYNVERAVREIKIEE
jgi:hypothetical protein